MFQTDVTVVMVCRNEEHYVEHTIESILRQKGVTVQLVVVEGNSTDRTLEKILAYESVIDPLITGNDRNIFDAMNKGIAAARGRWISFMNAGDLFAQDNALRDLLSFVHKTTESSFINVVYGQKRVNGSPQSPKQLDLLSRGILPFSHQASIVRIPPNPKDVMFDVSLPLYADFELFARLYKADPACFRFVNTEVALTRPGGVSASTSFQKRLDKYRAVLRHFGFTGIIAAFLYRILKGNQS